MKNAKLIIDGKEIEVQINEEDLKKITTTDKITGYERIEDKRHFYINSIGAVVFSDDVGADVFSPDMLYDTANYYSHIRVATNNARADKLMRQLRRFAVEHRKIDIDWTNANQDKYYLLYDYSNEEFFINRANSWRGFGQIYFDTEETAKLAVKTFRDELLWYFTEYRDSL